MSFTPEQHIYLLKDSLHPVGLPGSLLLTPPTSATYQSNINQPTIGLERQPRKSSDTCTKILRRLNILQPLPGETRAEAKKRYYDARAHHEPKMSLSIAKNPVQPTSFGL